MKKPLAILAIALPLAGCTKGAQQAKLKAEFDHICTAQKDFLSARKLKGVDVKELVTERARRMRETLSVPAAIQAVDGVVQPKADKKAIAEKAAVDAGLKDWTCPELAENP